jgi:hypothetical protein
MLPLLGIELRSPGPYSDTILTELSRLRSLTVPDQFLRLSGLGLKCAPYTIFPCTEMDFRDTVSQKKILI